MIVQRLDHAADGILDQLMVVDRINVVLAHTLDHFGQQPRILPGQVGPGRGGG